MAVFDIRSVDTERVPRAWVDKASDQLRAALDQSGGVSVRGPAPDGDAPESGAESYCRNEPCRIAMAKTLSSESMLHTRLVQYDAQCVLFAVLYSVETASSEWVHVERFACESAALESAVAALAEAFVTAGESASGSVYAVVPVQHRIADLKWASESFADMLAVGLARRGMKIAPPAAVALALADKGEASRICGDKKCIVALGKSVSAHKSVAATITQRKKECTIDARVYDLETGTSTVGAKARSDCAAHELSLAFDIVAGALLRAP